MHLIGIISIDEGGRMHSSCPCYGE